MIFTKNTILILVASAIVLLGAFYYFFIFTKDTGGALIEGNATASQSEFEFISLLERINPVTFDTTLFSNPAFSDLVNIHTPIVPELVGRKDPFATFFDVNKVP
jgi:hypothetical protein